MTAAELRAQAEALAKQAAEAEAAEKAAAEGEQPAPADTGSLEERVKKLESAIGHFTAEEVEKLRDILRRFFQ